MNTSPVRRLPTFLLTVALGGALGACDTHSNKTGRSSSDAGRDPVSPDVSSPADVPSDVPGNVPADATRAALESRLETLLVAASGGRGLEAFMLPGSDDYDRLPQDPANPLTAGKVALGQMLFHDTAFALNGVSANTESWSCATCHHAAAGFKSGARQGIGEGGTDFGANGVERRLAIGFDASAETGSSTRPDLQPFASPTILNGAWQDVMLWNGQFGNVPGGINAGVDPARLSSPGTPKTANARRFSGLETQAIAGSGVHRLSFDEDSPLATEPEYRAMWIAAWGADPIDPTEGAALAMAAFERTVVADRAPFQRWLQGEREALDESALRGATLFFGEAGCIDCHRGPALSSEIGATADELFFAIGFADLDAPTIASTPAMHGAVSAADRLGRGGFTGDANENHRFKIPPLYNLADASVFGHGASFASVREVIEYKNAGLAQDADVPPETLDPRHRPLALDASDIDALVAFLEEGLRDPDLDRYQPNSVPSGRCLVVDARVGREIAPGTGPATASDVGTITGTDDRCL